jgi:hypothetical protein
MAPYLACVLIVLAACGGDVILQTTPDAQPDSTIDAATTFDTSDAGCVSDVDFGSTCSSTEFSCLWSCCDHPQFVCVNGSWTRNDENTCLCVQ